METSEKVTILKCNGNFDRVPVREPDSLPWRYSLKLTNGAWYAQSGYTTDEAIDRLYSAILEELWKNYLRINPPTT